MKSELTSMKTNESPWKELTMIDYPRAKHQIAEIMLEKIKLVEENLYLANWYLQRKVGTIILLRGYKCRQPSNIEENSFQISTGRELITYGILTILGKATDILYLPDCWKITLEI